MGSAGVTGAPNELALPYVTDSGTHFSHIYCFSRVFSAVDLRNIAE